MMQSKSKSIFRCFSLLAIILFMTGCAVMDKDDCMNANWFNLGKNDALNGKYQISSRTKACAKHGLGVDKISYESGLQEGLLGFCTAASGLAYGEKGGDYNRGFCPASTEAQFLSGYTPAYNKYKFRQKMQEMQSQIDYKNKLLTDELKKKNINNREVDSLRNDIKRLQKNMQMEMYMRVLD